MRRLAVAVLLLTVVAPTLHAQDKPRSLELALSEEALQLRYNGPTSIGGGGNDVFYTLFLSEERDVVASAAILTGTDMRLGPVDLRLGSQAYAALLEGDNQDVFALALGVEARLNIFKNRGVAIVGSGWYSPDVLTFGSADNLTDFSAQAEMRINPDLTGFAGYRWFEVDQLQNQKRKLQNEIFVGVRWQLK